MEPKPAQWLSWSWDQDGAEAYQHRPPYPPDAIQLLVDLMHDTPRTVLDAGCGTGDVARPLAPLVERVDAVDPSAAMLAIGRKLPGGDHPHLRWQHATAEAAEFTPPYALITAGESLHWMDWPVALPRFADALAPHGVLAIVERDFDGPLFTEYSVVRDFRPMDVVTEIARRGLFTRLGERWCGPVPWRPTVDEYLECRHSQRGFARTQMGAEATAAFDAAIRRAVGTADRLDLAVTARVVWGTPDILTARG